MHSLCQQNEGVNLQFAGAAASVSRILECCGRRCRLLPADFEKKAAFLNVRGMPCKTVPDENVHRKT